MKESLQVQTPYFDRQTTGILKGIAVIMMFIHHFFTFPEWWTEGISYPFLEKLAPWFCMPMKLCVAVFCFITGYFYFFNRNRSFKYSLKKISDILISYWCVFLILAVAAVLTVQYDYTVKGVLLECFALQRPTMFFCWYVHFYISFMLLLPLITKIMPENILADLIISLLILPLLLRGIGHLISIGVFSEVISILSNWLPMVLMGYIFAKYRMFERIERLNRLIVRNKAVNGILMVILALAAPMGRKAEPALTLAFTGLPSVSISMDIIYAPVFIYAIVSVCRMIDIRWLKKILSVLGRYSLLMWFVSCIFYGNCKQIFQPVLYLPHNPLLVLIWGLILCLTVSFFLDIIIKKIQKIKNEKLFD